MQRIYPLIKNIKNKKISVFFAYMLYKNRDYGAAVNLTSNLIYNYRYKSLLLDGGFLKILYPRPYYAYVEKYSSRYSIPVNLIYGVMRQESFIIPYVIRAQAL
jgi:soluble lytic murein transglycosylase-like protein